MSEICFFHSQVFASKFLISFIPMKPDKQPVWLLGNGVASRTNNFLIVFYEFKAQRNHKEKKMKALHRAIQECGLNFAETPVLSDIAEESSQVSATQIRALLKGILPLDVVPSLSQPQAEDNTPFPLSDIQYAYLIGRNPGLELGGISSNFYQELDLDDIDISQLNIALNKTIQQHPMLRAVISSNGRQSVLPQVTPYHIKLTDTRNWPQAERDQLLQSTRLQMQRSLQAVDQAPSFAIHAIRLSEQTTRLQLHFDLMFIDIHSVHIVMRDWWHSYIHPKATPSADAPLFSAYLATEQKLQEMPQGIRDQQYWLQQMEAFPPAPELPLKNAPEQLSSPITERASRTMSETQLAILQQTAISRGLTAETLLLGAYIETLRQWSKHQNFSLTMTSLGRRMYFPGLENTVGNFLLPILLPVVDSGKSTFIQRLSKLQTELISHRWHSSFNGIQLLREIKRQNHEQRINSVPVVFSNTLDAQLKSVITDIGWEKAREVFSSNQTPQVWLENQIVRHGEELKINWNYVADLFPDGMVDSMLDCYLHVLHRCCNDDSIWEQQGLITVLPVKDHEEQQRANDTSCELPLRLLHEMVLDSVERFPFAIAVEQGNQQLSYRELGQRAHQIAGLITQKTKLQPGDIVAVSLPQGPQLLIAIMGILIAGAAYVAIDPNLPGQRRHNLLQRCSARAIVTDSTINPHEAALSDLPRIEVDQVPDDCTSMQQFAARQGLDDLAYVIFTSGSTGEPKGVMISHRNAANTVLDINRRFNVNRNDAVFSVAPAGFDLSVYDYFGLLSAGGRVVFQSSDSVNDPQAWCQILKAHGITIWNSVPAPVKALVDRCGDELATSTLRLILMSGDWIPVDLPASIKQALPGNAVISLGGATEGSIWSIYYPIEEVDPVWRSIPYGKPLANQRFHVLNDWLAPCPKWVTGELYIAGCGVAQGYLADKEKTDQRFIVHPLSGERLYKTGDLGRYLEEGMIEILGREDNQVKINGYRVELGEIEACLLTHSQANHIVINAPKHPKTGQPHLVAYIAPLDELSNINQSTLQESFKELVRKSLPSYMVPSYFILITEMPLSSNGKINRAALPLPWQEQDTADFNLILPNNDVEMRLLALWREQLKHEDFGVTDGFFNIGGDSLHAVGLLSVLRKEFSLTQACEQNMIEGLFMNASIRDFARMIAELTPETAQAEFA
jgi:amino acid adenylation domain-containing protein